MHRAILSISLSIPYLVVVERNFSPVYFLAESVNIDRPAVTTACWKPKETFTTYMPAVAEVSKETPVGQSSPLLLPITVHEQHWSIPYPSRYLSITAVLHTSWSIHTQLQIYLVTQNVRLLPKVPRGVVGQLVLEAELFNVRIGPQSQFPPLVPSFPRLLEATERFGQRPT